MRFSLMRYTKRCSKLILLHQTLESRYFKGSGLPTPLKGSWQTTSTKSRILSTLLLSIFIHHSRCLRKVGVKIGHHTLFSADISNHPNQFRMPCPWQDLNPHVNLLQTEVQCWLDPFPETQRSL